MEGQYQWIVTILMVLNSFVHTVLSECGENTTTTSSPTTTPQLSPTTNPQTSIAFSISHNSKEDSLFQLRLSGVYDCIQWRGTNTLFKLRYITDLLVQEVQQACGCCFTASHIAMEQFLCFIPQSPHHVTYRAHIKRTLRTTAGQLLTFIQRWINSTQSILIQGVQLNIDKTCEPIISTFDDAECTSTTDRDKFTIDDGVIDLAGFVIVGCTVAIELTIALCIGIMIIVLKRFKKKMDIAEHPSKISWLSLSVKNEPHS